MAIATSTAILAAAAVGAVGSVAVGAMQSNAANQAAQAQATAAERALGLQEQAADQARQDSLPWLEAGRAALNQYMAELGIETPENAANIAAGSKFEETPGFQYEVEQGEKAVINNLAALGLRKSGPALKSLTEFRQSLARNNRENYLNRLAGASGQGQQQSASTANIAINTANNRAQSLADMGAARASGYVGQANAWGNALQGVTSNASTALGRLSALNQPINLLPGW